MQQTLNSIVTASGERMLDLKMDWNEDRSKTVPHMLIQLPTGKRVWRRMDVSPVIRAPNIRNF